MTEMILTLALLASMAEGDAATAKGDHAEAAKFYRAELTANPGSFDAKFKLARALSFTGKRAEAIALYSELLATKPNNSDVLLARGRTYAWEKKWVEAEADLLAVTRNSPTYGDAWSALGDMYMWSDRELSAVEAYTSWINAQPNEPRAYIARGKAYRAAGNLEAARADFEAARARGANEDDVSELIFSLERKRLDPETVVPEEYKWSARIGYGYSEFSPDRAEWNEADAAIRRHWDRGSLALEYLYADRFSRDDHAYALDGYLDLWSRSYANLRYQYSPDALNFPDNAYRIEVFQGFGKGWELSGGWDHMDFGENDVDMYGAGLGKYIGNWYLRWKTLFIPSTAQLGVSNRALARYYWAGNADDYVEVNGGFGRGGQFRRNSNIVEQTRSHSFGAAIQKYFHPQWGIKIAAGYGDDENSFVERNASISLQTRW